MDSDTLKKILLGRQEVISSIRKYFDEEGFIEIETPLFVAAPDPEPTIHPFTSTWHDSEDNAHIGYLAPSPEFFMKKLLGMGSGNIFQITKTFRDYEGSGGRHNPEFLMIEWYRTNADYTDIMIDCEQMICQIFAKQSDNFNKIKYKGKEIDLSLPWPRKTVALLFEEKLGISQEDFFDETKLKQLAEKQGYSTNEKTYDDIFHQLFLNEIEPHISTDRPCFVTEYPASQAALAKKKDSDPRVAERFELYIGGMELANAFSELSDAKEQRQRFEEQLSERKVEGLQTWPIDEEFLELIESMSPTGGIALGVDRLIMLYLDVAEIDQAVVFPAYKVFSNLS